MYFPSRHSSWIAPHRLAIVTEFVTGVKEQLSSYTYRSFQINNLAQSWGVPNGRSRVRDEFGGNSSAELLNSLWILALDLSRLGTQGDMNVSLFVLGLAAVDALPFGRCGRRRVVSIRQSPKTLM